MESFYSHYIEPRYPFNTEYLIVLSLAFPIIGTFRHQKWRTLFDDSIKGFRWPFFLIVFFILFNGFWNYQKPYFDLFLFLKYSLKLILIYPVSRIIYYCASFNSVLTKRSILIFSYLAFGALILGEFLFYGFGIETFLLSKHDFRFSGFFREPSLLPIVFLVLSLLARQIFEKIPLSFFVTIFVSFIISMSTSSLFYAPIFIWIIFDLLKSNKIYLDKKVSLLIIGSLFFFSPLEKIGYFTERMGKIFSTVKLVYDSSERIDIQKIGDDSWERPKSYDNSTYNRLFVGFILLKKRSLLENLIGGGIGQKEVFLNHFASVNNVSIGNVHGFRNLPTSFLFEFGFIVSGVLLLFFLFYTKSKFMLISVAIFMMTEASTQISVALGLLILIAGKDNREIDFLFFRKYKK